MAVLSPADARLRRKAADLAAQYASGALTLEALRAAMLDEIRIALTAAMLSGTDRQTNAEIRATLLRFITRDEKELDRLMTLLRARPEMPVEEITRRLEAFADSLPDVQAEGERLIEKPISPLIPAVIGAAMLALLGKIADTGRTTLPRLDTTQVFDTLQRRMDELSDLYANKEILADEWFLRMQRELRVLHTALYQQGRGRPLTADDLARIEARVNAQMEFLEGFRDDLAAGKLTPEDVRRRARLYLDAGKSSLQEGAASRIGVSLPCYPGERSECQVNCKCGWELRTVEQGLDAYWRLRPAEHCPQCEQRAITWNPLQIRNGVIQPYSSVGLFI